MYLTKLINGDYRPAYNSDIEASAKIKVGSEVYCTQPRNTQFHRKFFALLKLYFENQDTYDNIDIFRQVTLIKCGFVNWVEGKDGKSYPFAQSISFEKMSQEKFQEVYNAVLHLASKEMKTKSEEIESQLENFY